MMEISKSNEKLRELNNVQEITEYNIPENAMIASTLLLLSSVIKQGGVGKGDVANVLKYYGNEIKESIYKEGVLADRLTNEKYFLT